MTPFGHSRGCRPWPPQGCGCARRQGVLRVPLRNAGVALAAGPAWLAPAGPAGVGGGVTVDTLSAASRCALRRGMTKEERPQGRQ